MSQDMMLCPKCGKLIWSPRFVESHGPIREHLEYRCMCGYVVTKPCDDAKGDEP